MGAAVTSERQPPHELAAVLKIWSLLEGMAAVH
jgi:hypothetical protein